MQSNSRILLIVALLAWIGAACTTAGRQVEGSSPDSLSFTPEDQQDQPVTEPTVPMEQAAPPEIDPAVVGPEFDIDAHGLTLAVSGDDGIWWFDANGKAQLAVEPAVAADYDGNGGLVFQREENSPIVRRTADASEEEVVAPGDNETIELVGVAQTNIGREVVYLRSGADSITLERTALDGDSTTTIADVDRDGVAPQRLSISDGYVSGVYLEGSGAGWVSLSLRNGQKLFGTLDGSLGECAQSAAGCAQALTIGDGGTRVYQVALGDDTEQLELIVNDASNFARLTSVNLQRPADGWHPTRVEVVDSKVIVSRSASQDQTGDLPALIVDPDTGVITQLDRPGIAIAVTG